MEDDNPFEFVGYNRGYGYQNPRGYGVDPVSPLEARYIPRFATGSGRFLIGPNTRFVDMAGDVDRFGGFPMESGLLGGFSDQAQPASMPTTAEALRTAATPQAVSGAPMEAITPRAMEVPASLGQELPQPTSVAGDVGKFFKSKQGGALLAAGGALLASGLIGGRPDESPITERIKELEGNEQYGRFLDVASRTAPSRADYLGVMAARGGSAVQAEEAAQAAQSRAAREAVSEYNRYRIAADAQAAELRIALQQQREQRRLAKIKGFGAALGAGAGFLLAGPAGSQIGGALGSGAGSILGDLTD